MLVLGHRMTGIFKGSDDRSVSVDNSTKTEFVCSQYSMMSFSSRPEPACTQYRVLTIFYQPMPVPHNYGQALIHSIIQGLIYQNQQYKHLSSVSLIVCKYVNFIEYKWILNFVGIFFVYTFLYFIP